MIRIIDRTMACLNGLSVDKPVPPRFLELLVKMGVDAVEVNNDSSMPNRIRGFDDALCGDYQETFSRLRKSHGDDVEFCPGNKYHCATALAVEWLTSGNGGSVVTSFCGIDGGAATEEVIMALRVSGLRDACKTYESLPEMTALFSRITKKYIRHDKPIIGSRIFHVESGIHVDAIIKHSDCYEPFPPEIVGLSRKIILGKQSGESSIRAKLAEHNIICNDSDIRRILGCVKARAVEKNGEVTDEEFVRIAAERPSW